MSGHESHGHEKKVVIRKPIKKYEKEENITDEYIENLGAELIIIRDQLADLEERMHGKLSSKDKHDIEHLIHEKTEREIHLLNEQARAFIYSIKEEEALTKARERVNFLKKDIPHEKIPELKKKKENELTELEENIITQSLKAEKNKENIEDAKIQIQLNRTRSEYAKEFKKHNKGIKTRKAIDSVSTYLKNIGIKTKNKLNSIRPSSWDWTRDDFAKGNNGQKNLLKKKDISEYETPELKAKRGAYDAARLAFADRMYEKRKNELASASSITEEAAVEELREKELHKAEASGVNMSLDDIKEWEEIFKRKVKSGEYKDEIEEIKNRGKIDSTEQIRRLQQFKAKEILQKTFFDERRRVYEESGVPERGAVLKLMHGYASLPRWKRITLSTILFTAGGVTGAIPFAPFAGAMIAKYGIISYAGMRFGLSAFTAGVATEGARGADRWNHKKDEEFKKEQARKRKESEDQFANGEISQETHEKNLISIEIDENEDRKKRMRIKAVVGTLLGVGAGAGAYQLIGGMMTPENEHITPPMTKGEHFTKAPAPVQLEKTLDEFAVKADRVEAVPTPPAPISTGGDPVMLKYPDLNIDQTEFKNMEGGLATTSDFTPHTTADEFNPGNSNADQTPAVEKPKYNFGDYNPDERNLNQENPESGERLELPKTPAPEGQENPESGERLDIPETPDPTGQENPESGERLDIPETTGDATEPKIESPTSTENTNTESDINNSTEKPKLKINFEETQKIQENQLTELKNELGEKEYNKIIKDLESKNIPYKSDSTAFRTISIGESTNENFARTIARNYAGSQVLEQTGQTQATIGSSRILDSHMYKLPNGEYRSVIIFETEKVNGQDVGELLNTEKSPITEVPESTGNGEEMKINPQETKGSMEAPNIESETNLAIENIIKEGKYKDIVKNVEMLGYKFEGSRSADVTVLKFLESYKSGEYTLAIDSADAPTHNLASQAISQRQDLVNTAEKMNLWKKTDSGYHMISIRLIKK